MGPAPGRHSLVATRAGGRGDSVDELVGALERLAERIEATTFELPVDELETRRRLRDEAARSIRDYLLPRLASLDAPVVAVVVGPTGAGKSTLVNALAGRDVSASGALRPTTRRPVLWAHRRHADRYGADMLPSFTGARPLDVAVHGDDTMAGVTLVDTPDLDSVEVANRALAEELLAAADLCVFVTSAQRYADALPWEVLSGVRRRGLPLVVVCNRLPTAGGPEILRDLRDRLARGGTALAEEALVPIAEQPAADLEQGRLPARVVAPLRRRLERLSDATVRRDLVVDAVRSGLVRTSHLSTGVAHAAHDEREEALGLRAVAEEAYAEQRAGLEHLLRDGELIREEVLTRWQAYVGTGELLRVLSEGAGRVRAWMRTVFGGPQRAAEVQVEAGASLVDRLVRRADRAAATAAMAWEVSATGRRLVSPALMRAAPTTADHAQRAVEDWLAGLAAMVEELGAGRRRTARIASVGVNVAAASTMLAVFAQTGGLTGAEVGITAGAAAIQQRFLEHLFGSAAARRIVAEGRRQLQESIGTVLAADLQRFTAVLAPMIPPADAEPGLRAARDDVERAGAAWLQEVRAHG